VTDPDAGNVSEQISQAAYPLKPASGLGCGYQP
jgi:hypothetical protein